MLAGRSPERLGVRFGDGAGGFAGGSDLTLDGFSGDFSTADLNHDGRLDVISAVRESVVVLLGHDGGAWQPPALFPATPPDEIFFPRVSFVNVGDFNQDGHVDVFAGGALLPGNGDGTLGAPAHFFLGGAPRVVVDWNRDGLLDLVSAFETVINERRALNRPPVAIAGPDRTLEYAEQFDEFGTELVSGSHDPDSHLLSYEWRDGSGALMSTDRSTFWEIQPPGTYTFTLTVRDGRGGEASDSVVVTIRPTTEIVTHTQFPFPLVGWQQVADATAASNIRLFYPNAGAPKVTTPLANPPKFVEFGFTADPTQTYKL